MNRICETSGKSFEITEADLSFYDKVSPVIAGKKSSVPQPKLCPEERLRRRQAWRNQRQLYRRLCDLCKKNIVSIYSTNAPFPVYCSQCWWSDGWDPFAYGREFDFSRPFFPQLKELQDAVPRLGLIHIHESEMDNSDYTNDVMRLKDCYLIFDGEQSRNCCYGETFLKTNDCFDFLDLQHCELCYECIACEHCYNLKFSHNCFQCSDSWFLRDCRGCRNCYCCTNLHQKEHYICNKPHTKDEYNKFIKNFDSSTHNALREAREDALGFWELQPVRFMRGIQNENVSGNYVSYSKNSQVCFNCKNLRDCKFCTNVVLSANDCYDIEVWGNGIELCYECTCIGENVRDAIGNLYVSLGAEKVYYSQFCSRRVSNLFGCIGLQKQQYCALNKSYSRADYQRLFSRIVQHMIDSGEWGEYPPIEFSPFAYNETVAHEYFPLSKEDVLERGWRWKEEESTSSKSSTKVLSDQELNGSLSENDILDSAICCESSKRLFRLQKSELDFYQKSALPLPRLHPDERHLKRMRLRNPRQLWTRKCGECSKTLSTSLGPERPEQVLCENCYQQLLA